MNLTVNKLPSVTWNKLHMNESDVFLEENPNTYIPKAAYSCPDVFWESDSRQVFRVSGELSEITASAAMCFGETAENRKMESPLILSYAYEAGANAASRLSLHAGAHSYLKAVLVLSGDPKVSAIQAELAADQNAKVDLYFVDLLGKNSLCLNHITGLLAENAEVNLIRLDLGGRKIYSGVNMDLLGDDASYHSETGYHVKPGQLLDMNYVAVHHGRRTGCQMQVNGTLEEDARKIFRGTIDFQKGCTGAKASENENVLLLGDELQNQTLPVILCKEEDVEGSHGASIGQLDDKVLFYLASRGISRENAQAMIAQARIDAICAKIPVVEIRSQIQEFQKVRGISYGEEL